MISSMEVMDAEVWGARCRTLCVLKQHSEPVAPLKPFHQLTPATRPCNVLLRADP